MSYILYIADDRRHKCPKLLIKILGQEIFALIDTGCELSIMNEHLYSRLWHEGLKCFELPTQQVNLLSAFNKKTNRFKKQAMLDVKIGDFKINQIVLLSPQLLIDTILGFDFLVEYKAVINFAERSITLKINSKNPKLNLLASKKRQMR
jgi:predicted aspartyl protease